MMIAGAPITGLMSYLGAHTKEVLRFTRFIPDALCAARRSKDMNTKVGAVVVDDDLNLRISGYNGPPRGVADLPERLSRPTKYPWTSHAEENCVAQAARTGVSLRDCTIVLTSLFPCSVCARLLIQAGVVRVLAPDTELDERWSKEWEVASQMFSEARVSVWAYDSINNEKIRKVV